MVKLLEEYQEIDVSFCDREEKLLSYLDENEADILLLDINLRDKSSKNGIEMIRELLGIHPGLKIIILSSYNLPIYRKAALKYGAKAFLDKSIGVEELMENIQRVYKSQANIDVDLPQELLTSREIEVIRKLAQGKRRKTIAGQLYISESTLYNHIKSIYGKLDANNVVEACNKALELGYLEPKI